MKFIAILVILTLTVLAAEVVVASGGQSERDQVTRLDLQEMSNMYVNGEKPIEKIRVPLLPVIKKLIALASGLEGSFTKDGRGLQDIRSLVQPIAKSNRKLPGFYLNGSMESPTLSCTWSW